MLIMVMFQERLSSELIQIIFKNVARENNPAGVSTYLPTVAVNVFVKPSCILFVFSTILAQ